MQTKILKLDPVNYDINLLKEPASILRHGGIIALPTETVYGLAADYRNKDAVKRLYEIKKRPKDKPFTIMIAEKVQLLDFIDEIDELTKRIVDRFWPGPLTIIVKSRNDKRIGFRMPSNKVASDIIKMSNVYAVVPSANISGEPELTEPFTVMQKFDGLIDMIVDAGPAQIGVASTVVDLSGLRPRILREGSDINAIRNIIQEDRRITNVLIVCTGNSCRSPMADMLLKKELDKEGFNIKSAGLVAIDDMPPSAEAVEIIKKLENIDMSKFVTHRLTKAGVDWADIIFVMERPQKEFIKNTYPEAQNKVYLFKEFANISDGDPDVPDPMGRPLSSYELAYNQIKEAVDNIVEKLKRT